MQKHDNNIHDQRVPLHNPSDAISGGEYGGEGIPLRAWWPISVPGSAALTVRGGRWPMRRDPF